MRFTRRSGLLAAISIAAPARAASQVVVLRPEQTVELEHEDRSERIRRAVAVLGLQPPPRFSTTRVPVERMPPNFRVSVPVLRVAFSERNFFETARWEILPQGMMAVAAVAAAARGEAPDAAIFVAGHTDDRGGETYNQNLSVNRANAVSDSMMAFGVGDIALWRVGFGESAPLYANDTDEHRGFNRRVEFLFGARVEPVVDVLSNQLNLDICVSDSEAASRRCIETRPRRQEFPATQATSRYIGVGGDGRRQTAPTPNRRADTASSAQRRLVEAAMPPPRNLIIPLHRRVRIAAPVR